MFYVEQTSESTVKEHLNQLLTRSVQFNDPERIEDRRKERDRWNPE